MNAKNAHLLVFVSGGVLVSLALLAPKGDTYKRVWAAGLWTTLLAIVADLVPEIVGPFALLIIIAAVAADQGVFGQFLAGNTAKPSASTARGSTAAATGKPGP